MATKTESTEVSQQKKVYVKSEEVLDEMEANGQLEPFTDYYTPDEEEINEKDWKLVWTNPSPTSSFANQTLTLDLSKYKTVSIWFKYGLGSSAYRCPITIPINGIRFVHYEADTNVIYRAMTINSNSIVFDACSSTSNWIPLWVYAK